MAISYTATGVAASKTPAARLVLGTASQIGYSRTMKTLLALLLSVAILHAENVKKHAIIISKVIYWQAELQKSGDFSIKLTHRDGTASILPWELDADLQSKLGFDSRKTAAERDRRASVAAQLAAQKAKREAVALIEASRAEAQRATQADLVRHREMQVALAERQKAKQRRDDLHKASEDVMQQLYLEKARGCAVYSDYFGRWFPDSRSLGEAYLKAVGEAKRAARQ